MAKVKPFKAILYNQTKIKDLSRVMCPPYDIINARAQEDYYKLSPYNIVRLILRKNEPLNIQDKRQRPISRSKYVCAKKELNDWLDRGILCQETEEAIYFYEQEYIHRGQRKKRVGFIALLKIGDVDAKAADKGSGIHAHEHTQIGPKEDRSQLLSQVRANLSPIFVLFSDKNHIIKRTQDKYNSYSCTMDIKTNSVRDRLWRITDRKIIDEIKQDLKSRDIFIADGHHRYEVACNFRSQVRKKLGSHSNKELSCDYVMAYFTSLRSRGLTILPTHRVIRNVADEILVKIADELSKYFDIYKARDASDLFLMQDKAGRGEYALGMYTSGKPQATSGKAQPTSGKAQPTSGKAQPAFGKENKFFLLRLKSGIDIDKIIDIDKPREYKGLSVVILNQLILKRILKFNVENLTDEYLCYTDSADLAIKMVDEREAKIAFFLSPVKVEDMAHLALQGVRLPSKSTFFYPKLPSGLTIYKFGKEVG